MSERIHRTRSIDGTQIVGSVHGDGPPLVLVHGSLEDGETDWSQMLPFLREHFTCCLMSVRGRGHSDVSADMATRRRVQDVLSFVDSLGEEGGPGRVRAGCGVGVQPDPSGVVEEQRADPDHARVEVRTTVTAGPEGSRRLRGLIVHEPRPARSVLRGQ